MINRARTQSQYVFNSETGNLEKVEDISTIPAAAQEKTQEPKPVTSITVITSADNLVHNYFYSFETSWDATNCLQLVTLKMPKMGQENINYWATYTGQLTVYMGCNFTYDKVNATTHDTEQKTVNLLIRHYNNSSIKPYFRGEVDRIKEYQNDIVIYVKNIGGRFQQKIPEEFRQSFIYNQNVRDAFQAICEFLGVQYICPPRTVTDEAGEETEGETETDGTENNVGQQVTNENKLAKKAKQQAKKAVKTNTAKTKINSNKTSLPNSSTNTDDNKADSEETEEGEDTQLEDPIDDIINGYDDINFDANGSIVHGSKVIETSPDMAHTLVAMEEHPFEKYLEDETGIVEKVNSFLKGEMFDEIHSNVMDYNAITIEPKAAASSDMSTVATTPTTTEEGGENSTSNSSSNSSSSSSSSSSKKSSSGKKGVWGKTAAGSYYLTQDAINKMSMAEAKRRYEDGKKRNIYTAATMQKLWYRMMFGTKFY